jgi:hypothetical protein
MLPMEKIANNEQRNMFIFCERIFFLNCIIFWTQYYPMDSLTIDVLQCRQNASSQATGDAQFPSEINKDCPIQRVYGTVYV